ncbi:uncharacterized protein [Haliotis asinina]|uniref:uncharacterized protein n=1 Tax=Haliotis asinina TaxID=109174 RepID=UPI003531BF8A
MHVFIFLVLIFTVDQIHAVVFQTSRTEIIPNLTKVDGKQLFSSGSLLFDVKSCGKVRLLVNGDEGLAIIDIYSNKTSYMQLCYDKEDDSCFGMTSVISSDLCDTYTPLWIQYHNFILEMGESCYVGQNSLASIPLAFILFKAIGIEISSNHGAWWRLGNSACQPVTTPAATRATTPSTPLETTPEATPRSLGNRTTSNETMPKKLEMGRSAGAVSSSKSITGMIVVVALMSFLKH